MSIISHAGAAYTFTYAGATYSLHKDKSAVGGVRLFTDTSYRPAYITSLSEEGKTLAREIAAMRSAEAAALSAEERYEAAKSFGSSYRNDLADSRKKLNKPLAGLDDWLDPGSVGTVSKQGTIVGISSLDAKGDSDSSNIYTIQVTRKDGFQLNLSLEEDLRINDQEDGSLVIYFAQSGVTKHYDPDGNETILEEAPASLGTEGDDIIINRIGSMVDAGGGDDTIIVIADNSTIRGGAGNDEIIVPRDAKGLDIDGEDGNDSIVLKMLRDSTLTMNSGQDEVFGRLIDNATITSNTNNIIDVERIDDSTLTSTTGSLTLKNTSIFSSTISLSDAGNNLFIRGTYNSVINTGNGNDYLDFRGGVSDSIVNTGDGNDTLIAGGAGRSVITMGDGDDTLTLTRGTGQSEIFMGDGNDSVTTDSLYQTRIDAGQGTNTISVKRSNFSIIGGTKGVNTITVAENGWFNTLSGAEGSTFAVMDQKRTSKDAANPGFRILPENADDVPALSPEELFHFWRSNLASLNRQAQAQAAENQTDIPQAGALKEKSLDVLAFGQTANQGKAAKAYAEAALFEEQSPHR